MSTNQQKYTAILDANTSLTSTIRRPIVAVKGLGDLGRALITENMIWVKGASTVGQSDHYRNQYRELEIALEGEVNSRKVHFVKESSEIFNLNPEILILVNGRHPKEAEEFPVVDPYVEEFVKRTGNKTYYFWYNSLPAIKKVGEFLPKLSGLTFQENNPQGAINLYLLHKYKLNAYKLTGSTADTPRGRNFIAQELANANVSVEGDRIYPPIFGDHGQVLLDINRTVYNGVRKSEGSAWDKKSLVHSRKFINTHPTFSSKEYSEPSRIRGLINKIAPEALAAVKKCGLSFHPRTREAIETAVREILTEKKTFLRDAMYCYFTPDQIMEIQRNLSKYEKKDFELGAYMLTPVLWDSRKKEVHPDPYALIQEANPNIRRLFMNQVIDQNSFVKHMLDTT